MDRLRGKAALIVGAKSDMGRATARAFAREGARLALGYGKSKEAVERLRAELRQAGCEAMTVGADVTREEEVARMFEEVKAGLGRLHFVVNYAGRELKREEWGRGIGDLTVADLERSHAVDARGSFLVGKHAWRYLEAGGALVLIGSWPGEHGDASNHDLTMAKRAVSGLALSLAKDEEYRKRSITVRCVALGSVATRANLAAITPEQKRALEEETAIGRMVRPEEVAELMLHIAAGETRLPPPLAEIAGDADALQRVIIPFDGSIRSG